MRRPRLLIDANLLVLLLVGTASRGFVRTHKRLRSYAPEDYDLLLQLVDRASAIVLTPNTLTEASNLASQMQEPGRAKVRQQLAALAQEHGEKYVASSVATKRFEFLQVGLTDSAILEAADDDIALLTSDLDLFHAALAQGIAALNFNHLREAWMEGLELFPKTT